MTKRLLYHIGFWLGYVFFKTYLNYISDGIPSTANPLFTTFFTMLTAQMALLLVKVPMVYGLFRIADFFLSKKWGLLRTAVVSMFVFIISSFLFVTINHSIVLKKIYGMPQNGGSYFDFSSLLYSFFVLSFVAGLAMALKFIRQTIRQREASQEITRQKLETELKFLKSQTNPHFLFNTLNNIYALARKKSDHTADAVLKLSKLLRFMLYESGNVNIPIADELKVIDSYIELEKIRYTDRLAINYRQEIDNPTQAIAPLILLPFVENAFKHGTSETRFDSFIHIDIKLQKGILYFVVENSKTGSDSESVTWEKIGLQNVTRQLELMYPGHTLNIENTSDRFSVELTINLLHHASV